MPATVTIQTAPRDVDSISKLGRFTMRKLAEETGLVTDDKSRGEFQTGSNLEQAQALAAKLAQIDGGTPTPAASAPVRTPSSKGRKKTAATPSAPANGAEGLLAAIKKLTETLEGIMEMEKEAADVREDTNLRIRKLSKLVTIACSASLTLGEEVCNAPKSEVLKAAIEDSETIASLAEELGADEDEDDEEEEEGNED